MVNFDVAQHSHRVSPNCITPCLIELQERCNQVKQVNYRVLHAICGAHRILVATGPAGGHPDIHQASNGRGRAVLQAKVPHRTGNDPYQAEYSPKQRCRRRPIQLSYTATAGAAAACFQDFRTGSTSFANRRMEASAFAYGMPPKRNDVERSKSPRTARRSS